MNAYVDSSVIVALASEEPGAAAYGRKLNSLRFVVANNLVEAEVRSAAVRLGLDLDPRLFHDFQWISPVGTLAIQIEHVLEVGRLRGADLYHLACALYFYGNPREGRFLTLDKPQRDVAEKLGFATDWSFE